ncbi:hypothetical protein ACQ4M3_35255 [Leptolyngbya sp. AN03gr2]|uniref:hypothetical protein n=1 Tax=unclassified Leptolyngbya TaxID=2650499 RepID=UPI003D30F5C8
MSEINPDLINDLNKLLSASDTLGTQITNSKEIVEILARLEGITEQEVIHRAIATEAFIKRRLHLGGRFFVKMPNQEIEEIAFKSRDND